MAGRDKVTKMTRRRLRLGTKTLISGSSPLDVQRESAKDGEHSKTQLCKRPRQGEPTEDHSAQQAVHEVHYRLDGDGPVREGDCRLRASGWRRNCANFVFVFDL